MVQTKKTELAEGEKGDSCEEGLCACCRAKFSTSLSLSDHVVNEGPAVGAAERLRRRLQARLEKKRAIQPDPSQCESESGSTTPHSPSRSKAKKRRRQQKKKKQSSCGTAEEPGIVIVKGGIANLSGDAFDDILSKFARFCDSNCAQAYCPFH